MIITILCVVLFVLLMKERKQKLLGKVVKEEERKSLGDTRSNWQITNDYFNLRADCYMKENFNDLLSWEWDNGNCPLDLHYMNQINKAKLAYYSGKTEVVEISTSKIWGNKISSKIKTEEANNDASQIKESTSAEEMADKWIKENSAKIVSAVEKTQGNGFWAYVKVLGEYATPEILKEIVSSLNSNTAYEVSFKDDTLEIGFQNA